MPPFAWDGRKLASPNQLRSYLTTLAQPAWPRGVVIHHTWNPTVANWRSSLTMDGMRDYYRDRVSWRDAAGKTQKGWPSGPHLFVAPDGIWVGTPPNIVGTHAGVYNSHWWGVEVVGDYDKVGWPPAIRANVYAVVLELLSWKGITRISKDTVRGHRECSSPKSCPGKAIDMDVVRSELDTALAARGVFAHPRFKIISPDGWAAVRIAPNIRAPKALDGKAQLPAGTIVEIDSFTDGWGHLASTNVMRDLGFINAGLLQPL